MAVSKDQITDKLRAAYDLWHESKGHDPSGFFDIMAERCSFHSLAAGAPGAEFTAPRYSREEMHAYFYGLAEKWEMIYYRVDHIVVGKDRIAAAIGGCKWLYRPNDNTVETSKADIWTFDDEGRAIAVQEFYDTARFLKAAGALVDAPDIAARPQEPEAAP